MHPITQLDHRQTADLVDRQIAHGDGQRFRPQPVAGAGPAGPPRPPPLKFPTPVPRRPLPIAAPHPPAAPLPRPILRRVVAAAPIVPKGITPTLPPAPIP